MWQTANAATVGDNKMKLNLWKFIWSTVWNISERTGIGLGKFAPWVFHQMIGCDTKVNRVDE